MPRRSWTRAALMTRHQRLLNVVVVCLCVIYLRTLIPILVYDDSTLITVVNVNKHVPGSAVFGRDSSGVGKVTRRQNSTLPEGAGHRRVFPRLLYIIEDDATMHVGFLRRNKTRTYTSTTNH